MKHYNHFTLIERECLAKLLQEGKKQSEIAKILGKDKSSISRELKRNSNKDNSYSPWKATCNYLHRRKKSKRTERFLTDPVLIAFTEEKLNKFWSPELITIAWKKEVPDRKLSHSTIYRGIKRHYLKNISEKTHLRRHGKMKYVHKKSATIKPNHLINDWPEIIKNRGEIGHWEGDTMLGGVGKGGLVTMVDRMTRILSARLILSKNQEVTKEALLKSVENQAVKSISLDNGSEFALFREIEEELGVPVYFANPRSPWQRPTNEYTNGLLRFFFPKGFDFRTITQKDVDRVVELINTRPRKCLDFLSPADFFRTCCT